MRKKMNNKNIVISQSVIISKIYFFRGKKVMIDHDLANLYGVETRRLNEQVRRNLKRFPNDFMFQLNEQELKNWMSQFATSNNSIKMGIRKLPYVFTEQGVAMLSSVLNSNRAIKVNIQIIRTFIKLREWILSNKDLKKRIDKLEEKYDEQFKIVFEAIKQLLQPPPSKPKKKIGFITD